MSLSATSSSIKGPAPEHHDGSSLRIAIIHARWNPTIISPLVAGAKAKLLECGVRADNIVTQACPGSWELPITVQRLYSASQIQSSQNPDPSLQTTDLLGSSTTDLTSLDTSSTSAAATAASATSTAPFDAIVAIGVLIKGQTMHFEHIAGSVSEGLMRVQLDTGVPVVFGLLTVLNETQAEERAGISANGHNHGEDWGLAAVEMGLKRREWAKGKIM